MVEAFVRAVGKGVMKLLILDRGFIDGKNIGCCKQQWGIDMLIPMKRDLDGGGLCPGGGQRSHEAADFGPGLYRRQKHRLLQAAMGDRHADPHEAQPRWWRPLSGRWAKES